MLNAETLEVPVLKKLVSDEEVYEAYQQFLGKMDQLKKEGWRPSKGWLREPKK